MQKERTENEEIYIPGKGVDPVRRGQLCFTLLVSTIIPIYFNYLAEEAGLSSVTYLAYWGYAASVATLAVAFIGPVFGAVADTKNYKKPVFLATLLVE